VSNQSDSSQHRGLSLSPEITRRDFVNGALVGTGAALLSPMLASCTQGSSDAPFAPSGSAWTGYGGVGDYQWSNGNTEIVRDAAHQVRDGLFDSPSSVPVAESYDVVVVGGGFSGLTAAYEFAKADKAGKSCLLLENHPVPGGEAKQNEFDVDGIRLTAPQGSNAALVPTSFYGDRYEPFRAYWKELGLPYDFSFEPLAGGAEKYHIPNDHFDPMFLEETFDTGYFFEQDDWRKNPVRNGFADLPWSAAIKKDLADFASNRRDVISRIGAAEEVDRFLDSITYRQLLDRLNYGAEVSRFVDPVLCTANFGVCGDAVSALAAKRLTLPGTIPSTAKNRFSEIKVVSFPGGNAAIYRTMLKRIIPAAIDGKGDLVANAKGRFALDAFDRPGQPVRMRLGATVVRVEHDGPPDSAGRVLISYVKDGKPHRVAAKAVVMATGGWITRRVLRDMPEPLAEALGGLRYGPVMVANVALRHWRFFDKLGIIAARWFEGLGWHATIRRNVDFGTGKAFTPDSPTVLTLYIALPRPGHDAAAQGAMARQYLIDTPYQAFERQIVERLTAMFGAHGFNAERDVAGIVLNRWGHAYSAPQPGFFFGREGGQPPHEIMRAGYGRVILAHSEMQGNMNMAHAMLEGGRGGKRAIELIG
jgi:spermidine dehydrogenase